MGKIKVYNWIDYTEEIFNQVYWGKTELGEQYKRKYRKKIIESEMNAKLGELDISDNIMELLDLNTIISESVDSVADLTEFD